MTLPSPAIYVIPDQVKAIYVDKSEKNPEKYGVYVIVGSETIECNYNQIYHESAVEIAEKMVKQIEDALL